MTHALSKVLSFADRNRRILARELPQSLNFVLFSKSRRLLLHGPCQGETI